MRRKVGGTRKTASKKKAAPRRRRRIGNAGGFNSLISTVGGLAVGGIIAREGAILLGKVFPSLIANQMIDGAVQVAAGYFLPKLAKGQFMQFVSYGIMANGLVTVAVGTGVISGPGNVMNYRIGGTANLKVIGGTGNLKVVGAPGDNRIQNANPVKAQSWN